jgi:hypothetical protein
MGVGIPGYTGFTPAEECVSIPMKAGCMERAPIHSLVAGRMKGDGGTVAVKELSTHKSDFTMTPEQFALATAADYGWDPSAKNNIGDPPFVKRPEDMRVRPFLGRSTFRDAFGAAHDRPMPSNVTALGQLRPHTANNSAEPALSKSDNPFYETEYSLKSSQRRYGTAPKFGGRGPPLVAGRPRSFVELDKPKLRRELPSTSYRNDFGLFGDNPADSMPQDPSEFSTKATTAEHMRGTPKSTFHPPGYTGFIPAAAVNHKAVRQAQMADGEASEQSGLGDLRALPVPAGYPPRFAVRSLGGTVI